MRDLPISRPKTDRLNGRQRAAIQELECNSGFDFMYIEEINSRQMTFAEAWSRNVTWLTDWVYEAHNSINLDGCGMLKDLLKDF